MILTKDKGMRMWGGGFGKGSGGSGGSGGGGGVSAAWVEQNYLSKEFFSQIFKIKATVTETVEGVPTTREIDLLPNTIADGTNTTLKNVKVEAGLWTDQFLSALGLNSGGGGGGATTLGELLDVAITNPQNGQALIYNSGTGMWVNGAGGGGGGGGTVTSVGMTVPTGFAISGSPITASGTLALSFASGYSLPLTADVNKGVTAYGWGDHAQAGYALASNVYSKTDADQKFMTIAAFENLFNAVGSDGSTKINHPYASGVASIKAMVGLWTEQYLSALGQNGGGGGVTLNEPLASINAAGLGAPSQSGVAIMWNGAAWTYQVPGGGGGTVTSITAGTGLSGGTITTMGTIAIDSTYQGYIQHGETAYGWGNHASAGYATPNSVDAQMQNYAYISNGEIYIGNNSITPLTSHQSVDGTFWGRSWSNHGTVNGSIDAGSNGGAINGFHSIELNNYGTLSGYGGFIDFHFNGSSSDYTSRIIEDASGRLFLDASVGVRIGGAMLSWDSTNNALKIQKIDGTAANLYATGGVSALGVSTGGSVTNLIVDNDLTLGGELTFGTNDASIYMDDYFYIESGSTVSINGVECYSRNVWLNRLYLDTTRYLYVSGGTLYYYNGSESKQIAFIN